MNTGEYPAVGGPIGEQTPVKLGLVIAVVLAAVAWGDAKLRTIYLEKQTEKLEEKSEANDERDAKQDLSIQAVNSKLDLILERLDEMKAKQRRTRRSDDD